MRKGFTLVELIIVIIIVGILAAVGMTQYTKVVEKGRAAEARLILGSLRTAEVAEYIENGAYALYSPGNLNLGVDAPTACAGTHFFSYGCDATGLCTATRCQAGGRTPNVDAAGAYSKTLLPNGTWGGTAGY